MPEELPDVLVATFEAKKGIVAEIDPLLAHHDVHLHRHVLKATDEALAQVLQVVIAHYQIDFSIKAVEHFCPLSGTTQAEIAQVEYCIVWFYDAIPIRDYRLVHLFHILERSVAELDDICVIEMGVGGKERMLRIEIEVHCYKSF